MDRQQLLAEIKRRLLVAHGWRLRSVVLYGSEARGEAQIDSDIDVLVVLDGPLDYGRDLRTNIDALYDLVLELERPISAKPVDVAAYAAAQYPPVRQRKGGRRRRVTVEYSRAEWDRAVDALRDAHLLRMNAGFDSAASRAYYAAFHGVSALFGIEGRTFTKHAAVEAAVHRDLVKTGRWSTELGRDFSFCIELRGVGDYGSDVRVHEEQARDAISGARRILMAIRGELPVEFQPLPDA